VLRVTIAWPIVSMLAYYGGDAIDTRDQITGNEGGLTISP
jgi:hypothetical protein